MCKIALAICLSFSVSLAKAAPNDTTAIIAAKAVIARTFGESISSSIHYQSISSVGINPVYEYEVAGNELYLRGSSAVAICKSFYDYLKTTDQGMITWSGKNVHIGSPWKPVVKKRVESPYQHHYYFNVVTYGYTTPYWDFARWQKEIDWMSLHGLDMPLINGAYEAILARVFRKLGIPEKAINNFFTGPAYHPWNRMGNITGWDNQVPASYNTKQIKLTHQVLNRMHELGMEPIISAFAGFVPKEISNTFPEAKIKEIIWGGFSDLKNNRGHILLPDNALFSKIGTMYVKEWEKEFGKAKYYLADSFNEMDVPPAANEEAQLNQLANYGSVVFQSIHNANPDAVWVMQGWTFPYQKGKDGKLFWTAERLGKLVEKTPDDKVLFLDLANEYNLDSWKIDPSWKTYNGFFNKSWIYSFIPNMGGKTPWNGILQTYANAPSDALKFSGKGNLVGFGFAPEGIENNEIIYELLSDIGWTGERVDLAKWIPAYSVQRYGAYPETMKEAFAGLLASCYGTFEPHPRFRYQQNAKGDEAGSVNTDPEFFKAVKQFLAGREQLSQSELYRNDAIELSTQFLSLKVDSIIQHSIANKKAIKYAELTKAYRLLHIIDKLLLSHPNHRLDTWITLAKNWGDTPAEKLYYARDAKRLITTWGGTVNDYAARTWGGLIDTYYIERMKHYYQAQKDGKKFNIPKFEESWIQHDQVLDGKPFADPLKSAADAINQF